MTERPPEVRSAGAAVYCPTCGKQFGGMRHCPWDGAELLPLHGADPMAVAFYAALAEGEAEGEAVGDHTEDISYKLDGE